MDNQFTDFKIQEVKETGGARIGMMNASWPFAKLQVNKNELKLNVSIMGNLHFTPSDVISIEPYQANQLLGGGIKINHRVENYNEKVIFQGFGSSKDLISRIRQTGFLDNANTIPADVRDEIIAMQSKGGFPIKIPAIIAIFVIWNLLFLSDFYKFFTGHGKGFPLGIGARSALFFMLLTCVTLLISEPVRKLILKEGRTINDIKVFVYFIMFITGVMLLFSILLSVPK
jgi:hypothetical protein